MTQDSLCNLVISTFVSFISALSASTSCQTRSEMWRPRLRVGEQGGGWGDHGSASGGDGGTMGDHGSASAFAAQEQDLLPTNNSCKGL